MVLRRPSSQFTTSSASSAKSSLKTPCSSTEEWDADDEDAMSAPDDFTPSRPLSLAIPTIGAHGPYCPRRPNLSEILANVSPAPWTLAAFMAYLSRNHCLEILEFTMDAGRYRKHYAKMMSRASQGALPPTKDREYVQALWQRLVDAYIRSNGSREVNLPSDVRDTILRLASSSMPPDPSRLDPAVAKMYELMEDSVLVPFLNSVYPQSAHAAVHSCPYDTFDDGFTSFSSRRYPEGDRIARPVRRSRDVRISPPRSLVEIHSDHHSRHSHPSPVTSPSPLTSRFGATLGTAHGPQSSSPAAIVGSTVSSDAALSGPGLSADDSGSTGSPVYEGPTTPPPISPSASDHGHHSHQHAFKRDSGMWKTLGRLSGMHKTGRWKSNGG